MKKRRFISIILLILLTLSSCKLMELDNEAMMSPPKMSAADREILRVLESVSASYQLIYPKAGNYQTAVTYTDISGDGQNEAVCFFTEGAGTTVSCIVVSQQDEKWRLRGMAQSRANAVDKLSFCDLNGDGVKELVIGWLFLSGEEKAIEVFGLSDETEMQSLYSGMYNHYLTFDNALVVISRNTGGKTASAALLGKSGSGVAVLNTVALNNTITSFISVQSGMLDDTKRAIYIDEQLESLSYTTEVLMMQNGTELVSSPEAFGVQSMRTRPYICTDVNDDERLDIPTEKAFAPYERNGVTENLTYVEWIDYDGAAASPLLCSYTSVNEYFMIRLPQRWIGSITVRRDEDTDRTIRFYCARGDEVLPMFSIRVFSQQEFSEFTDAAEWPIIATSNENVYTYHAYNDSLPKDFATDSESITALFKLLS